MVIYDDEGERRPCQKYLKDNIIKSVYIKVILWLPIYWWDPNHDASAVEPPSHFKYKGASPWASPPAAEADTIIFHEAPTPNAPPTPNASLVVFLHVCLICFEKVFWNAVYALSISSLTCIKNAKRPTLRVHIDV
jgi:hypothetical protein